MPTRRDVLAGLTASAAASLTLSAASPGDELCTLPAVELARRIRAKQVSAREVMQAHLARIERVNPKVNAIVTLVAEQAMENAKLADEKQANGETLGPLHGLPVAHKDLVETRGIRTTFGSPLYQDYIPEHDALIVERIRGAGAITVGKTNTPEFGAGSHTFNKVFGATHNPYNLAKTCGGSSGGAAVALRCGLVPIADGSDMGGSLRNPAAFSNVVGLRPAPGRVPSPALGLAWSTLSVSGPMGRSVADVALLLSAIAGPDYRSPVALPEPGSMFARPLDRAFRGVRVAFFKDLGGVPFEPAIRSVVESQVKVFEGLGCKVEQAEPDFTGADEAFKTLRAWTYHANYGERAAAHRDAFKDTILWEVDRGAKLSGADISHAETLHAQVWLRFQEFLRRYDYFVLPTTQVPPFDITTEYPKSVAGVAMQTYIDWMKSCWYISITANPAISVPCGFTPDGLPVGLQIVGRHQDEWSVLQMAHAFEQVTQAGAKRTPLV